MKKEFKLSTFVELAPKRLLRDYLTEMNVGRNIDWETLPDNSCEHIIAAINSEPKATQHRIETEFREVNRYATPMQIEKVICEGRESKPPLDLATKLRELGDNLAQSLWLFINHRSLFEDCLLLEQVVGRPFVTRPNLPPPIAPLDESSKDLLSNAVSKYFQETQGRGARCQVERVERDNRHIYFCHLEDHAQTAHEWTDQNVIRVATRWPVFDVILVYDSVSSTLQTYMPGSKKNVEQIESVFGKCILGNDLTKVPKITNLYALDQLLQLNHVFEILVDDPITNIVLRELKLEYRTQIGSCITFSVPISASTSNLYTLIRDLFDSDDELQSSLSPVKAKFTATFKGQRRRTRTFSVSCINNTCDWPCSPLVDTFIK